LIFVVDVPEILDPLHFNSRTTKTIKSGSKGSENALSRTILALQRGLDLELGLTPSTVRIVIPL